MLPLNDGHELSEAVSEVGNVIETASLIFIAIPNQAELTIALSSQ